MNQPKTISFVLRSGLAGEEREALLAWLRQQQGCRTARYLSQNPGRSAFRIGHASADQDRAARLCEAVRQQPQVESAEIEIPRGLTM